MMGQFPLWLIFGVAFLQKKYSPGVEKINYVKTTETINLIRRSITLIPKTKIERWLLIKILVKLDQEQEALETLQNLNVTHIGVI